MNDKQLRQCVVDELDFDPSIDSTHLGIQVENGIVTLTGHVSTYSAKIAAERVAWRVKGVRAIVQNIQVHPADGPVDDQTIAERALGLLKWDSTLPPGIHLTVNHGWVTLAGRVLWHFQRVNAENDLRQLSGIRGITNDITVSNRSEVPLGTVRQQITDALKRNAEVEAGQIQVDVSESGAVTLEGVVDSWRERRAIQRAAWSAPGVRSVIDRLTVATERDRLVRRDGTH